MNYSVHPGAETELEEAENHYDAIDIALGNRFRSEFEAALSEYSISPMLGNRFLRIFGVVDWFHFLTAISTA